MAAGKAAKRPPSRAKPTARQAFDANMADAELLFNIARMLQNDRQRRMRVERRARVGAALNLPKRSWAAVEIIENDQVFLAFKPGVGSLGSQLDQAALRPLLRQAVVAACAAVETFVADRVMEHYSKAIKLDPIPPRLLGLSMTVDDWLRIDSTYKRRAWGLRNIVELEIRERSSPTPSVIGQLFSMVAIKDLFKKIDSRRHVVPGTSEKELDAIRIRRNKIAHEGDRSGRGRATITVAEVERYLMQVMSIIDAMDAVTKP